MLTNVQIKDPPTERHMTELRTTNIKIFHVERLNIGLWNVKRLKVERLNIEQLKTEELSIERLNVKELNVKKILSVEWYCTSKKYQLFHTYSKLKVKLAPEMFCEIVKKSANIFAINPARRIGVYQVILLND
jgi:hypothetical protein